MQAFDQRFIMQVLYVIPVYFLQSNHQNRTQDYGNWLKVCAYASFSFSSRGEAVETTELNIRPDTLVHLPHTLTQAQSI